MKIRMKLSVMMIVVTLISTALMGIFTYTKSTATIMNLTESSMEQANTNKAQTIGAMIDKEKRNIQLVAGRVRSRSCCFRLLTAAQWRKHCGARSMLSFRAR